MMSGKDRLEDAIAAFREQTEDLDIQGPSAAERDRASATRARVVRSLHEGNRRRTGRLMVWLPLAAIFIGGTAWATGGGGREIVDALFGQTPSATETPGDPGPEVSVGSKPPLAAPQLRGPESIDDPVPVPVPTDEAPTADAPESDPSQALAKPETAAAAPANSGEKPSPAPVEDSDALALYEQAHQIHFSGGDPGAARTAWERYLRAAPGGRFATEANYNRALCLIRLGDTAAAKRALTPFAEGAYGGYRQSEARALLDAL